MHSDPQHTVIPIDRFREIVGRLDIDHEPWADAFWLRFAAHLVALRPETAEALAERIRAFAHELREHSPWYATIASPVRFAVAAMLAQSGERPTAFIGEHARISEMLTAVGLRPHGIYGVATALILHQTAERRGVSHLEVARLKAIYDAMKRHHWWLTGADDLPACAALAHCSGTATKVVEQVEEIHRRLHESGLHAGAHLQTAANLLPLAGVTPELAVRRYLALKRALEDQSAELYLNHYSAVAVLSLLFHDPKLVIDRVRAVRKEIDLASPSLIGDASFNVAADLVFLDLVRFDWDQQLIADVAGLQGVQRSIASFNVMMAVILSQTEVEQDILAGSSLQNPWI